MTGAFELFPFVMWLGLAQSFSSVLLHLCASPSSDNIKSKVGEAIAEPRPHPHYATVTRYWLR